MDNLVKSCNVKLVTWENSSILFLGQRTVLWRARQICQVFDPHVIQSESCCLAICFSKKRKKNLSCRSCFTYLGLVGRLSFTSSWCFSPNWTFYQLRLVRQLKLMGWVKEVGCGALFAFLMCGCRRWQQLTNASGNNFSLVYGEFLQVQVLSFSCHNFLFPSSYVEGFPCWWEALT